MSPAREITQDYAMDVGVRFLRAASAMRDGDAEAAVELLAGPFDPDNERVEQDMVGLFSAGAIIAGRTLRSACSDPADPSPFDGPSVLQVLDARSGFPAHPEDLPPAERLVVWAAAAGANLDSEGISAHLGVLLRRGGFEAVTKAVTTLVKITAAAWDGGPLR